VDSLTEVLREVSRLGSAQRERIPPTEKKKIIARETWKCEYRVIIVSDFNETLYFSLLFFKSITFLEYQISWKICSVRAELSRADGQKEQTDMTKMTVAFRKICGKRQESITMHLMMFENFYVF